MERSGLGRLLRILEGYWHRRTQKLPLHRIGEEWQGAVTKKWDLDFWTSRNGGFSTHRRTAKSSIINLWGSNSLIPESILAFSLKRTGDPDHNWQYDLVALDLRMSLVF